MRFGARGNPDALEMGVHRSSLTFADRPNIDVAGQASGVPPPMVNDPLEMVNAVGVLREAEHQLEVLHPVVGAIEATPPLDQRSLRHKEVANVHHTAEELR